MTKLFIVHGLISYEPGYSYGVFTTHEKAEKAGVECAAGGVVEIKITEVEVDTVYPDGLENKLDFSSYMV